MSISYSPEKSGNERLAGYLPDRTANTPAQQHHCPGSNRQEQKKRNQGSDFSVCSV